MTEIPPAEIYELQKLKLIREIEQELRERERKRIWALSLLVAAIAFIGAQVLVAQLVAQRLDDEIKEIDSLKTKAAEIIGETRGAARDATSSAQKASDVARDITIEIDSLHSYADGVKLDLKAISSRLKSESGSRVLSLICFNCAG